MISMVCFHFFYKQVATDLAPKFDVSFRYLVTGGSFPTCWRLADVGPVSKGFASSEIGLLRPISITPVLSKVFENIVAGKLSHYLENNSMLSPFHFLYLRGLETCDAFLRSLEKFPDYPLQVATSLFRPSHCYITFHAYFVVISIGINPQQISYNYSRKMAEQFYK